tara:strand:+ start:927 stop:2393 length:1467 start_codon:yes stop_codon:yes gene_type:complete
MSVLETFFILFEADSSGADKDVKALDKNLDGLEKSATDTTDSIESMSGEFVAAGKSALGAVAGVAALVGMVATLRMKAQQLDELGKFSELVGESVGDIDAWSQAVVRAGGSSDGFQQSIKSLNEKLYDTAVKGTSEILPFFNQLGISITDANGRAKKTLDILPELAAAFEGLTKRESAGLGQKLGLDEGTVRLLQSGSVELASQLKLMRMYGVASEEATKLSADFNDRLANISQVFSYMNQQMLVSVLPAVNSLLDGFTEFSMWLSDNQALVEGFFIGVGLAALKFAVPAMISLATTVWLALAPFLLIGAAVLAVGAAFAVIYDDVQAFMNGQDSFLGEMVEKYPIVGKIIEGIAFVVKLLISEIKGALNILNELGMFLIDVFTDPMKALEKLKDLAAEVWGSIKGFFGFSDTIVKAEMSIKKAESNPMAGMNSQSIQNSRRSTKVSTGDIIIQTQATDAAGISAEVGGSLRDQIAQAVDSFDDGVLA